HGSTSLHPKDQIRTFTVRDNSWQIHDTPAHFQPQRTIVSTSVARRPQQQGDPLGEKAAQVCVEISSDGSLQSRLRRKDTWDWSISREPQTPADDLTKMRHPDAECHVQNQGGRPQGADLRGQTSGGRQVTHISKFMRENPAQNDLMLRKSTH
ncbi:hypothetical protein WMY93_034052, partial [Mugilogobius chulae]